MWAAGPALQWLSRGAVSRRLCSQAVDCWAGCLAQALFAGSGLLGRLCSGGYGLLGSCGSCVSCGSCGSEPGSGLLGPLCSGLLGLLCSGLLGLLCSGLLGMLCSGLLGLLCSGLLGLLCSGLLGLLCSGLSRAGCGLSHAGNVRRPAQAMFAAESQALDCWA